MMGQIRDFVYDIESPFLMVVATIGIVLGLLVLSFLIFTFEYWIVTLVLAAFFNFVLPFSWWYSLGAWIIWLLVWPKTVRIKD